MRADLEVLILGISKEMTPSLVESNLLCTEGKIRNLSSDLYFLSISYLVEVFVAVHLHLHVHSCTL